MWAVGSYRNNSHNTFETLTEYWNGTQWSVVNSPNPGVNDQLQSVRFTKEGDVWAAGSYQDSSTLQSKAAIFHWNDRSWQLASNPRPGISSALVGASTNGSLGGSSIVSDTVMIGSYTPKQDKPLKTLVESLKAPLPPYTTTTYYETQVSASDHYAQGCAARQAGEKGIVVLDYGQPRIWSGLYGTLLIGSGAQVLIKDSNGGKDITKAVEGFIEGYMDTGCTAPGSSFTPNITVVIGTNNNSTEGLVSGHAVEWATMLSNVYGYIVSKSYTSYVNVAAGMDIEPSWSSYQPVEDWVTAYSNQQVGDMYNYGNIGAYPAVPTGEATPVVPPPWGYSTWNSNQIYTVSWGIGGTKPLPAIFQAKEARNWHRVASWTMEHLYLPMKFSGATSWWGLSSGYYDPQQAWQTLFIELNSDPRTWVHQAMENATDIKCSSGTPPSCKP